MSDNGSVSGRLENEYLGVPLKRYTFAPVWQVCRGRLVAQVHFPARKFSENRNQGSRSLAH